LLAFILKIYTLVCPNLFLDTVHVNRRLLQDLRFLQQFRWGLHSSGI